MKMGIYGEVSEVEVRILMTRTIHKTLVKFETMPFNIITKLNKMTVDGIDQIKFALDRGTYKFTVKMQFTEDQSLWHGEMYFKKVYSKMLEIFNYWLPR